MLITSIVRFVTAFAIMSFCGTLGDLICNSDNEKMGWSLIGMVLVFIICLIDDSTQKQRNTGIDTPLGRFLLESTFVMYLAGTVGAFGVYFAIFSKIPLFGMGLSLFLATAVLIRKIMTKVA